MGREESVVQARPPRCMPRQATSDSSSSSSAIWKWLQSLSALDRSSALCLEPRFATLLVQVAQKAAGAPAYQCALFEWDWLSHQLLLLGPKRKAKQAVTARSSQPAGSSAEEPDDVFDEQALQGAFDAGQELLNHVELFVMEPTAPSASAPSAYDGATVDELISSETLLKLASRISSGRFLCGPPPPSSSGGGGSGGGSGGSGGSSGSDLLAHTPAWAAELDAVHAGALALALIEAAAWSAFQRHNANTRAIATPPPLRECAAVSPLS